MKIKFKAKKSIGTIWAGATTVVALAWVITLYSNVRQGRTEVKAMAIQTLRKVAEQAVSREFDRLGEYYLSWHSAGKKNLKRKAVSTEGVFEIEIDSLNEAQGLYPLDLIGSKADILNCYGKFPLEKMGAEWKNETSAKYDGARFALSLKVQPLGKDSCRESFAGNEAIILPKYALGTYYLDGMYTMTLTAYMQFSAWRCVDWTDTLFLVLSGLFLFSALAGLAMYVWSRLPTKEENTDAVLTTCRFGEYVFDVVNHTLTYREEEGKACTPQTAKLLLGFAKSPDLLLTKAEIAEICEWQPTDSNINERRRKAISMVKKLFSADDSVQIRFVSKLKGYKIFISE